ncbi:MAG TPA: inorganic phosphate transporter, partial [Candidatus Eisenbacteria bacterium]|nr:inorganic phosphate transporter [Candidatus Eisenbacteria bacterium]
MQIEVVVVVTVGLALAFDVINGFHDSANSIATVVSTRVLKPRTAVLWAAFFNFVAMFVFAPKVADTISKIVKVESADPAYVYVVLSGLVGAIIWDLLTWWWALPTSSSHALIGGFAGAGVAHAGWDVLNWDKVLKTLQYIPLAPLFGMALGFALMLAVVWIFRRWRPGSVDRLFRRGQLLSAALYSLGHGGNDAQKTMGIIVALLVAAGLMSPDKELSLGDPSTLWIILSCHLAMAVGTAFGGWRIVRTMGMRIT